MENDEFASSAGVVERIAASTAARRRRPDYQTEVRALLDAALKVIRATGKARVSDIVEEAGLSNDAFYRHFQSKDQLVAALIEDVTVRLAVTAARQMSAEAEPEDKVRRWLTVMLSQAELKNARPTRDVLSAGGAFNTGFATGDHHARRPLAQLLVEPFRLLGSINAELDSELVTHAVMSRVSGHLWAETQPDAQEFDHLLGFCLAAPRNQA